MAFERISLRAANDAAYEMRDALQAHAEKYLGHTEHMAISGLREHDYPVNPGNYVLPGHEMKLTFIINHQRVRDHFPQGKEMTANEVKNQIEGVVGPDGSFGKKMKALIKEHNNGNESRLVASDMEPDVKVTHHDGYSFVERRIDIWPPKKD